MSRIARPYTPKSPYFRPFLEEKRARAADAAARCANGRPMRYSRRSMILFLALVTTLLGEFFLLVWRVQQQPFLAVLAVVLFALAIALWIVVVLRVRRDRLR